MQLCERSTIPDNDVTHIQQKYLFYTNKYPKNHPLIDIDVSIPKRYLETHKELLIHH